MAGKITFWGMVLIVAIVIGVWGWLIASLGSSVEQNRAAALFIGAVVLILAVLIFVCCSANSFATWSIIMIDPKTNEIGIAAASCTYNCYGIGKIIPSMGAIIVQAMSNNEAREKGAAMILEDSKS